MQKYAGFVYEWTNKITNQKYIGSHKGSVDDKYLGFGTEFRKAVMQYGLNSFERKILEFVSDIDQLADAERKWLEKTNAINSPEYYNKSKVSFSKTVTKPKQLPRSLCKICNLRPVAVNYKDIYGVIHYRSTCSVCNRERKKLRPQVPQWFRLGYRKKPTCDRCGFKFKLLDQSNVFHLDGNLKNNDWTNLRTICLNCTAEIYKSKLPWKVSPIVPDF